MISWIHSDIIWPFIKCNSSLYVYQIWGILPTYLLTRFNFWLNLFVNKTAQICWLKGILLMNFNARAQTRPSTNPKSQSMINERLFCSSLWCSGQARFCFTCFCKQKTQKLRCSVHSIYYAHISNWNVPCEN